VTDVQDEDYPAVKVDGPQGYRVSCRTREVLTLAVHLHLY